MPVQEELEAILERLHRMREQLRLMPDGHSPAEPAAPSSAEAASNRIEPIREAPQQAEIT